MNLSNAWENFSDVYSSFSLAYFSVKRTGQVVNTVNHSLVLPELFSPKACASSIYNHMVSPILCQVFK